MKLAFLLLLVAGSDKTLNIGLRDQSVIEDVRPTPGRLPRAALEILGVQVGRDRLRDARSKLGVAPLLNQGGPHAALGICYETPLDGATLVVETGSLEFDPTDADVVDTLVLVKGAAQGCGRLATKGLSTRSGLRLGMTSMDVVSRFGPPGKRTPDLLLYAFVDGAVMAVVEAHLERGVVRQLVLTEWRDSGE